MVEGRRGLGRGLSALLDEVDAPAADAARPSGSAEIAIDAIKPNPGQPRRRFDDAELEELARSIREKGVLQPILVRPAMYAGEFQIVAGERRWRAAQLAGLRDLAGPGPRASPTPRCWRSPSSRTSSAPT